MHASNALLQLGYLFGVLWSVASVWFGRSRFWEAVCVLSIVMGLALAAGAWPRWRMAVRVLAVAVFLVGVVLSLWVARGRDYRQLATPQRRVGRLFGARPSSVPEAEGWERAMSTLAAHPGVGLGWR